MKDDKKLKSLIPYEDISSQIEEDERHSYSMEDTNKELSDFIITISENIKNDLRERVLTDNEIRVGNSLTYILDNWQDLLDSDTTGKKYNKNLILLYTREMTNLSTKDIRNAMKRYRSIYYMLKDEML